MMQLDLFSYQEAQDQRPMTTEPDPCEGCRHNRREIGGMMACHRYLDTGQDDRELHDDENGRCSGYDEGRKRGPDGKLLLGMYYERSTGRFVSFSLGRRYWEGDGAEFTAEWRKRTMKERFIE